MSTYALKSPSRPSTWVSQLSTVFSGIVSAVAATAAAFSEARAMQRAADQRYPFLID